MEVQDESRVRPNHVFAIPPDRNLIISGGTLRLRPRESSGVHRSIDRFFRSLAEDQGHKAIGVVLSGIERHDPLRAWVLGCSSGEQAYSIAMTFVEFTQSTGNHVPVHVFATDQEGRQRMSDQ
jgi:CheB methylesterase/CheR methyltransferase, SAM binding domain